MAGFAESLDLLIRLTPPLSWERAAVPRPAGPSLSFEALYRAARRAGGGPLADGAARALLARLRPGSRVLLTTGLVTPHIPCGETDGPPGTLALARALILGLGVAVSVLTESRVLPILAEGAEALATSEGDGTAWRPRLRLRAFPSDPAKAAVAVRRLFADGLPAAVISIEKLGPNGRGVVHTMRGENVTAHQARADLLFPPAHRQGVLTIGVGDRGNEIGMGGLLTRTARCACPCRGGIACVVRARKPVVAFTSNWGAHAVTAALAAYLGRPGLLHRPQSEARMLRRIVRAGAVDGATRERVPTVDGTGLTVHTALLALLRALVVSAARP
jgi:hypothetical protein